jgi:hypothetical protein
MTNATATVAFRHGYPSTFDCIGLVVGIFGVACCPAAGYGNACTNVSKKSCHCGQKPASRLPKQWKCVDSEIDDYSDDRDVEPWN